LLNQLLHAHPMRAARLKRIDRDLVTAYARLGTIPPADGPRRVSLHLYGWPRGRLPDPDAPLKSLLDALVHARLLVDDGAAWCVLGGVRFERAPERRTVITLEDLAGGEACR
jgi:Holliday junction resolvase RusA-like endonuclease